MEKETGIDSAYIPIICDVMNDFNGPTKVVLVFPRFDSTHMVVNHGCKNRNQN